MVSAAEQFASNFRWSSLAKSDELLKRLLFTLGALIVYRLGTFIPLPGIDPEAFSQGFRGQQGGLLGTLNIFAGGAVARMAIFALNIMPYISAAIIMQLMSAVVPSLEQIKKEGEQGRRQINQYTRYLTVFLATLQGYFIAVSLQSSPGVVVSPGPFFLLSSVATLVGGVMFLLWLGEQVTSRGIGNGVSLIIFAGIVAELPRAVAGLLDQGRTGTGVGPGMIVMIGLLALSLIVFVVFIERSQRRILVQYPRRQVGQRMMQGDRSHLPLKLNVSGVIPPIFASSLLLLPATAAGVVGQDSPQWLQDGAFLFAPGRPLYVALYAFLIIGFTFIYTSVVFNVTDVADNLRKNGGFIQGYRPGARTAEYLDYVLSRLTVIGALYLAFVCVLPEVLRMQFGQSVPVYIGGTSLLIVVAVTLDTVSQVQGYLFAQQYESLIRKSKLRGGRK